MIVVVVDVLLIIEGRGVREDCHADAKQTHEMATARGGEGWRGEGEREREREDLETSHECSHARSLNIRTEAMRRGGEGCDGAAVGRE